MMTVRCYLAPSSIEGLGVYCHDSIKKGDVIWRFDQRFDRLIPETDLDDLPPHMLEFIERYTYYIETHPGFVALDVDEGRFMNHSESPNCAFPEPELGRALCDIPAGVELTCDYSSFIRGEIVFQPSRHRVDGQAATA